MDLVATGHCACNLDSGPNYVTHEEAFPHKLYVDFLGLLDSAKNLKPLFKEVASRLPSMGVSEKELYNWHIRSGLTFG